VVRQLLAFSRKQVLEFKPLDLDQVLAGFEKLLRHTIREDIALRVIPNPSLPPVRGDIGQIEQVLMNLAVNAQDAMPEGGRLTFETAVVHLDEAYAQDHQGVNPGRHVLLTVSDTGQGMDAETQRQIFEPFFTTKEKSKGTGLGLATVYGIVQQHGGHLGVSSEPGLGTAFRFYFPCFQGEAGEVQDPPATLVSPPSSGAHSETILLVEDNEMVRDLAQFILTELGYTVLVAENGSEALSVLGQDDGPFHLLLTDVVMPGMNGKELYLRVAEKYPDLKVLYMSGYTDDEIAHHGVLEAGVHFIQKPFTVTTLNLKVREALGA
jgi:CheY-like chemotaxis protein